MSQYDTTTAVRCPPEADVNGDFQGCGSYNVEGPDRDGLCDCLDCGLWFTPTDHGGRPTTALADDPT